MRIAILEASAAMVVSIVPMPMMHVSIATFHQGVLLTSDWEQRSVDDAGSASARSSIVVSSVPSTISRPKEGNWAHDCCDISFRIHNTSHMMILESDLEPTGMPRKRILTCTESTCTMYRLRCCKASKNGHCDDRVGQHVE